MPIPPLLRLVLPRTLAVAAITIAGLVAYTLAAQQAASLEAAINTIIASKTILVIELGEPCKTPQCLAPAPPSPPPLAEELREAPWIAEVHPVYVIEWSEGGSRVRVYCTTAEALEKNLLPVLAPAQGRLPREPGEALVAGDPSLLPPALTVVGRGLPLPPRQLHHETIAVALCTARSRDPTMLVARLAPTAKPGEAVEAIAAQLPSHARILAVGPSLETAKHSLEEKHALLRLAVLAATLATAASAAAVGAAYGLRDAKHYPLYAQAGYTPAKLVLQAATTLTPAPPIAIAAYALHQLQSLPTALLPPLIATAAQAAVILARTPRDR